MLKQKLQKFTMLIVVVSALSLARATDKPAEKVPDIPDGYQSKFQALVIRQQKAQMEIQGIVQQYNTAQGKLNSINDEAKALQNKMFKEMGLDPKDYYVQLSDTGVLVVVHPPKEEKKEEKK